jgi:hypothetical protein
MLVSPRRRIELMQNAKKNFKDPPTSTSKVEKANKGHENSIDPELGQKGHG